MEEEFKNILVFESAFIGDTVLTTPLLVGLRRLYPYAKITYCTLPSQGKLFEQLPEVDEVIYYDKRGKDRGLLSSIMFAKKLRSHEYDLIITPHKSFRTALVLNIAKNKEKCITIGFSDSAIPSLFTHSVEYEKKLHIVERILCLLQPIMKDWSLEGLKKIAGAPITYRNERHYNNIKKYLKLLGKDKVVCIAPESEWETKMWLPEYYAWVIQELVKRDILVMLVGKSKELGAEIEGYANLNVINLMGLTSLEESVNYIANADLLISNDSGLLHIANSQGVMTVAIFGPTIPEFGFYPYGDIKAVIENKSLTCRPCGKHGHRSCPMDHFLCMKDISVHAVLKKSLKRLKMST